MTAWKTRFAAVFIVLFTGAVALAQWQVPKGSVPVGRGAGVGFSSAVPQDVVNILDYTPGNAHVADYTSAFNAALVDMTTRGIRRLYFPSKVLANYVFASVPNPMTGGIILEGDSTNSVSLVFNSPETALWWQGSTSFGGGIKNIGVYYNIPTKTVTGITKANPAVVSSTAHGYSNGQRIVMRGVVGMTEVNDLVFTVAGVAANTFQLSGIDSSAFTAYVSGGTAQRTGNALIYVGGGSGAAKPDQFLVQNVVLSGVNGSLAEYPFLVDGANNQGQGGASLGVRDGFIFGLEIFNAATFSADFRQARSWNVNALVTFQGGGPALSNRVSITGPNASFPSDAVTIANLLSGGLLIDQAIESGAWGLPLGGVTITSNAVNSFFYGPRHIVVTDSSTTSRYMGSLSSIGPILTGKAGTVAGSVAFENATSGRLTVAPPAGALGTPTLTLPALTGTVAVIDASQVFTATNLWTAQQTLSSASVAWTPLNLVSTDAGGSTGPIIQLVRDSASPAASDAIGALQMYGKDTVGNTALYAQWRAIIMDPTDGSEDSRHEFSAMVAGAATVITHSGPGMIIGSTTLATTVGTLGMNKITTGGAAPGAAGARLEVVCGTNAGTAKLQMFAGTSTTPVTVVDNVGAGVTAC